MIRVLIIAILAAAPLAAFDFAGPSRRTPALFLQGQDAEQPSANQAAPEDKPARILPEWNSRGVSISPLVTVALVYPGAGIGFEVGIPLSQEVSLTMEVGLVANIFYTGVRYDLGARGYFDISEKFTLTLEIGARLGNGRAHAYAGGKPDNPVHSLSIGAFANFGFEVGRPSFRFFTELTLNGAHSTNTHYQVEFFNGINIGFRVYFGAAG